MSPALVSLSIASLSSRRARVALTAMLCVLAPGLAAQETQNGARPTAATPVENPGMVVARTVNPRIAYRGVPTEENPIHTEATLFPARTFHAALDGTIGELLGDEALGARGSAGIHAGVVAGSVGAATQSAIGLVFLGGSGPLGSNMGAGATSIGPGAAVGGAVGRAVSGGTAGFGSLIGAMPAVVPARQGGGP